MTDNEICQRDMLYPLSTPQNLRHPGSLALSPGDLKRTTAMTIEIIHLTAQIQLWLNARVASILEAQAARLEPTKH